MDAWNVLESGKNWGEADGELCEQLDFINSYVMHIQNLEKGKELVPTDELTKCVYIPIGVGVAVSPWNFPLTVWWNDRIGSCYRQHDLLQTIF